jgi:2-hydroxy-3-keto-5-methylthiopentenyl-1-phosphate phosphatase
LRFNGVEHLPIFANDLIFLDDQLIPSFPYINPDCPRCAHCKKTHLIPDKYEDKSIIFIGDGRSDLCAADVSDLVFAKSTLAEYLKEKGADYLGFEHLGQVAESIKTQLIKNR